MVMCKSILLAYVLQLSFSEDLRTRDGWKTVLKFHKWLPLLGMRGFYWRLRPGQPFTKEQLLSRFKRVYRLETIAFVRRRRGQIGKV